MNGCLAADYYWRDYRGFTPCDAIPAGNDRNGDPLYIGSTYVRNYEFLTATIFPKEMNAQSTSYEYVFNTTEQVKILCSPHLSAFEWIPIKSQDLHLYTSTRLVIPGGYEDGQNLYIGRVFRKNDVIVGKVVPHTRPVTVQGIWFPLEGKRAHSLTYDLLVYNCQKVSESQHGACCKCSPHC